MTAVINPNGESVHYGYDSRDRRVRTDQVWNQDEDGDSTNSDTTTVSLISAYDGREELGQWLTENTTNTVNTNGRASPYRSLTGLPQEEQGLPYNLMLHQQLFEPNRPELHAAGNKGADTQHLYLYGDHQNSTVQVRDQDSREAMRLGYSPFGQVYRKHNDRTFWKLNSGVNANNQLNALMPYQYTGRYTEAATGLVHLDARWYNPHTQRFVQPDLWNFRNTGLPSDIQHELMRFTGLDTAQLLRDPSQQVAYGYVSGNPLAWTDWLGLCDSYTDKGFWQKQKELFDSSLSFWGEIIGTVHRESTTKVGVETILPTSLFDDELPDISLDVNFVGQSIFHNDGIAFGVSFSYGGAESGIPTPSLGVSPEFSLLKGGILDQLSSSSAVNIQAGPGGSMVFDENNSFSGISLKPGVALDVSASTTEGGFVFYLDTNAPYAHFEAK